MSHTHYDEDDEKSAEGGAKKIKEWDCPDCNANNPLSEPAGENAELRCNYCGEEYKLSFTEGGKPRFKSL